MTEWREECVQCGEEFGPTKTNFCAKCCHGGIDEDLRAEYGFFVDDSTEDSDAVDVDVGEPATAQAGLGDFA